MTWWPFWTTFLLQRLDTEIKPLRTFCNNKISGPHGSQYFQIFVLRISWKSRKVKSKYTKSLIETKKHLLPPYAYIKTKYWLISQFFVQFWVRGFGFHSVAYFIMSNKSTPTKDYVHSYNASVIDWTSIYKNHKNGKHWRKSRFNTSLSL